MKDFVESGLNNATCLLDALNVPRERMLIRKMGVTLADSFKAGGKVLVCGNGGSACDAMHFAEELTGKFRHPRPGLPAIALTDPGHLTCVGNDYGFKYVFSRHINALGKKGDVLVALSTSGNSENVIEAVVQAKRLGMMVLLLLGNEGGALNHCGHTQLVVPSSSSERIQEIHMTILHLLVETVEREMFPQNYKDSK